MSNPWKPGDNAIYKEDGAHEPVKVIATYGEWVWVVEGDSDDPYDLHHTSLAPAPPPDRIVWVNQYDSTGVMYGHTDKYQADAARIDASSEGGRRAIGVWELNLTKGTGKLHRDA